jgi:hypothetical protein
MCGALEQHSNFINSGRISEINFAENNKAIRLVKC